MEPGKRGGRVTKITIFYHLKPFLVNKSREKIITNLEELTKINIQDIPIKKEVLALFKDTKALKITSDEIFRNTGALALGIFDTEYYDILLAKMQPASLEDLKNILKIDFKNCDKYTNVDDFLKKEKVRYYKPLEIKLWNEVLYAYYLGYFKYYYPLEFYKVIFDNVHYYLNLKVINEGYRRVRERILELNDVAIEKEIIPRKKTIKEIEEEKGLELILEILARKINIEVKNKNDVKNYEIIIKKREKKLTIMGNIKEMEDV